MKSLRDKLRKEQRKSATNDLIENGLEFNGGLEKLRSCQNERENLEDTSATRYEQSRHLFWSCMKADRETGT